MSDINGIQEGTAITLQGREGVVESNLATQYYISFPDGTGAFIFKGNKELKEK